MGLVFNVIKIAIVGLVEQFCKIIDNILLAIEGKTSDDIDFETDSAEGNYVHYTIEDLIYNRIPALDVDLISTESGGEEVKEGSALAIIKSSTAGWYVSIRNIAVIVMFVMIIYTGIRMAISTAASQRADYKKQIFTWVKCMALIFIIHYVIILVLELNNSMCQLFSSNTRENTLYNTIKTRAYDTRLGISIAGAIMYVALFIYWIKFLIVYVKRYIKNLILIIMAPLVIVRYAFDNASSKGKQAFNGWLNSFVLNVMIQTVHAILYSIIMGIAVDLATESVSGFVIALVFMSNLLKFDDIIFQIFRFNGESGKNIIEPMKQPLKEEFETFGKIKIYADFGKNMAGMALDAGKFVKDVGQGAFDVVRIKDDEKYRKTGSSLFHNISNGIEDIGEITGINDAIRYEKALIRDVAEKEAPDMVAIHDLKKNAKRKDEVGTKARKVLKKYKKQQNKKYTAKKKMFVNDVISVSSTILAIPMAAAGETNLAVTMFDRAVKTPVGAANMVKDWKKEEQSEKKNHDEILEAVNTVNIEGIKTDIIEGIAQSRDRENTILELEKIERLNANSEKIRVALDEAYEKSKMSIDELLKETIDKIDENKVLKPRERESMLKLGRQIIEEEQEKAKRNAYRGRVRYFETNTASNRYSEGIVEQQVSEENIFLARKINQMKNINYRSKATGKGEVINVNKFISDLRNM